jgi:hypothetical protein
MIEPLLEHLEDVGRKNLGVEHGAFEAAPYKKCPHPPEQRAHGPERQVLSGKNMGAGHVVVIEGKGEQQRIHMAFVGRHEDDRSLAGAPFDGRQRLGAEGDRFEQGGQQPPMTRWTMLMKDGL